ncbi:MAG: hypothetical protein ACQEXJ_09550 [Myxococcota bacterium]
MNRTVVAIAVAVALAGCDLEPDVGSPIQARCSNEDSDPDTSVSFREDLLEGIFLRMSAGGCARCHTPEGADPIGITVAALDLSDFESLMEGGVNSGTDIVVAGQPCDSVLYQKLTPSVPFGSRMPLDGPPFLSDVELSLVHDWIAEGARDN